MASPQSVSRPRSVREENELTTKVLDAAFEVHRELGPGLLESAYEEALSLELREMGFTVERQVNVPVSYKGRSIGVGFRADIIVDDWLVLELKAVKEINDEHIAQIITYMKFLKFKRGYILNFNKKFMKDGIKRVAL